MFGGRGGISKRTVPRDVCILCGCLGRSIDKRQVQWPRNLECPVCGLEWFTRHPSEADLAAHYFSAYDHYLASSAAQWDEDPTKYLGSADYVLSMVQASSGGTPSSLLEVGSSYPVLSASLRERGVHVEAVEPNPQAREWGLSRGVAMHESLATVDNEFDAIYASHVLEHVSDPAHFMATMRRLLPDDGTIIIKVPNAKSWQSELLQVRWEWAAYPDHLWGFSPLSLTELMSRSSFSVTTLSTDLPLHGSNSEEVAGLILPSSKSIEMALRGQQIIAIGKAI